MSEPTNGFRHDAPHVKGEWDLPLLRALAQIDHSTLDPDTRRLLVGLRAGDHDARQKVLERLEPVIFPEREVPPGT